MSHLQNSAEQLKKKVLPYFFIFVACTIKRETEFYSQLAIKPHTATAT